MNAVDRVLGILANAGARSYGGEAVTQLSHALQCANWAQAADAPSSLVAASLLHDIGHLLYVEPEEAKDSPVDDLHENRGAHFLSAWFPLAVTEPIRLHVSAKRYLCATEDGYFDRLSAGSIHSLELQGGVFSEREAQSFIAQPYAADAVRLRRWDEAAKDPDAGTRSLEAYRTVLESLLLYDADVA